MGKGTLGGQVRSPTRVVVVVGREDVERVHSVNEPNLLRPEPGPVDGEGIDAHIPERDGVEGSLAENDTASSTHVIVEEKPPHVDALGIAVLGSITLK